MDFSHLTANLVAPYALQQVTSWFKSAAGLRSNLHVFVQDAYDDGFC